MNFESVDFYRCFNNTLVNLFQLKIPRNHDYGISTYFRKFSIRKYSAIEFSATMILIALHDELQIKPFKYNDRHM